MKKSIKPSAGIISLLLIFAVLSCKKEKPNLPNVTTKAVTDISYTTAISGGSIINDGGLTVLSKGICWSTSQDPTINNSKTTDGTGSGGFISSIAELTMGTIYYVRAYATYDNGTVYGEELTFATLTSKSLLNCEQAYPGISGISAQIYLGEKLVTCQLINGEYIYQGDIVLRPNNSPSAKGAADPSNSLWPDNKVYFTINNKLPNQARITDAMEEYESKTNLVFIPRTNEQHYIDFIWDSKGCGSFSLGMNTAFGEHNIIKIADWGVTGNVIHEIGHSIGLLHEQSKGGRDNYVTILWDNILDEYKNNFDECTNSINTTGFDFGSIMLYPSRTPDFSKNGEPTIVKKDGSEFTAQREGFSSSDIDLINILYPLPPTITTSSVTAITTTTALCGGNITNDGGWHVYTRGVCWSLSPNPTITDNKTSDGTDIGSFTSSLTGLSPETIYYVRAYAINSSGIGTGYGNEVSFTTLSSSQTSNPTDIDGNSYNTITIGSQVWMKENLRTTKYNDGTDIPPVTDNYSWWTLTTPGYCWYRNDAATYKPTYGALYNWYAIDNASNGGKNVCPTGWHVPTDTEWTILIEFLGGESNAGGKLKEVETTHWMLPNTGANNESGFTALPGGTRENIGAFTKIGINGDWWSATENDANSAWYLDLYYGGNRAGISTNYKLNGYSIRCLRDN